MAKAVRKRGESAGDARGSLLASAAKLFASRGYATTTVREIVERAGVTKPVLYYYFRSKEGIYLELMGEPFRKFESLLRETASEEGTAKERLVRMCLRVYETFLEHLDLARVMYAIYYGPPQGAPHIDFEAYHRSLQEAVRGVLEEGMRLREFRRADPADMMWAVMGTVTVAMELELCSPSRSVGKGGIERMLDLLFEGIAFRDGIPKGKGTKG